MPIFMAKMALAKWPNMAKDGHLAIYGHCQIGHKYGHDGYPWKEHNKTSSPVKTRGKLGVCINSYDQNKNFEISPYVRLHSKTKK